MMLTFERSEVRTAFSCAGASVKPVRFSHQPMARSGSIGWNDCGTSSIRRSFAAVLRSANQRSFR